MSEPRAPTGGAESSSSSSFADARVGATSVPYSAPQILRTPGADFTALDPNVPLVLLPLRLETRFAPGGTELLIRVYPDEICVDALNAALTADERAMGASFWSVATQPSGDQTMERAAWGKLVNAYGAIRSSWIVRATAPAGSEADAGIRDLIGSRGGTRVQGEIPRSYARMLPDRFHAIAYRGDARVGEAWGEPIAHPLVTTGALPPVPDAPEVEVGTGLRVDREAMWTIDFDEAEARGMAMRMRVSGEIDQLVVLGVRASESPEQSATGLRTTLEVHRHSRGVAVVPQGTATNNSGEGRSGWPEPDAGGAESFAAERQMVARGDGHVLFEALGLGAAAGDHVRHANVRERAVARAMNEAIFPATIGYALAALMPDSFTPAQIDEARAWFVQWVSGRGPFPALRVGHVPYGILPVTSLFRGRYAPRPGGHPAERPLAAFLQRARAAFADGVANVPTLFNRADRSPGASLLRTLQLHPSSRAFKIRRGLGPGLLENLSRLLGSNLSQIRTLWSNVLARASEHGVPASDATILGRMLLDANAPTFQLPSVSSRALSETQTLEPNYIRRIRTTSPETLRHAGLALAGPGGGTMLYRVLRNAALATTRLSGVRAFIEGDAVIPMGAVAAPEPRARAVESTLPFDLDPGGEPVSESSLLSPDSVVARERWLAALDVLAETPTAELDRAFSEAMDCVSHRFDAWATSLATARLAEMRAARPAGVHVGAYGYVEGLRRSERRAPSARVEGHEVTEQVGNGGYIHAPSLDHAAAAAVLRSGHLAHSTATDRRLAIDLSSRRVRTAQRLIDQIREGQPLAALLGYQVERTLHERRLDDLIAPLRRLYPIAPPRPDDATRPPDGAHEAIAPRDVIDGLTFARRAIPGSLDGVNDLDEESSRALRAVQREIDQSVDALTDLLTAESVFQLVRGNTGAAAVTMNAIAGGARPPDAEIAKGARGGIGITHRVVVAFDADTSPLAETDLWRREADAPLSPRASLAPALDAWVGRLLGDPSAVACAVHYKLEDSDERPPPAMVTLRDLGLRPLDVLVAARGSTGLTVPVELQDRIAWVVISREARATQFAIDFEATGTLRGRTFPQIVALARTIDEVVGSARPLRREDLAGSDEIERAQPQPALYPAGTGAKLTEISDQLARASREIHAAVAEVPKDPEHPRTREALQDLRATLARWGAFGLPQTFPSIAHVVPESQRADLLRQAAGVAVEFGRRANALGEIDDPIAAARRMLGDDVRVAEEFDVPDEAHPGAALRPAAQRELGATLAEVRKWFMQAARVRPALARYRRLALLCRDGGNDPLSFSVMQRTGGTSPRWVALPFHGAPDYASATSVAIHAPHRTPETRWTGLALDEWTEVVPSPDNLTGIAFHYDDPGAEAPHCVLVAVPPEMCVPWTRDTVADVVRETFDLAKLRAVDLPAMDQLAEFLPLAYLEMDPAEPLGTAPISPVAVEGLFVPHIEGRPT